MPRPRKPERVLASSPTSYREVEDSLGEERRAFIQKGIEEGLFAKDARLVSFGDLSQAERVVLVQQILSENSIIAAIRARDILVSGSAKEAAPIIRDILDRTGHPRRTEADMRVKHEGQSVDVVDPLTELRDSLDLLPDEKRQELASLLLRPRVTNPTRHQLKAVPEVVDVAPESQIVDSSTES